MPEEGCSCLYSASFIVARLIFPPSEPRVQLTGGGVPLEFDSPHHLISPASFPVYDWSPVPLLMGHCCRAELFREFFLLVATWFL